MIAFSCKRSTCPLLAGLALLAAALVGAAEPGPQVVPGSPLAIKQEYQAQFERRDWTAAAAIAQKMVDTARPKAKTDPFGLADALILLGSAEAGSKNALAAEQHFGEALQLVEGRVGPASSRLIEPLAGLGYAFAAQNKHESAIPLMERALVLWRRNYGLFDPKQQGLLRNLAESEGALRRITEGEGHMLYLLSIGERNFGRDDARLIPLLCTVANWYVQNGLIEAGRMRYRIALGIAEAKLGKTNLAAVEPLRGLGISYVSELFFASSGSRGETREAGSNPFGNGQDNRPISPRYLNPETDRVLGRALSILDANANRPTQTLVDTLVQIGDVLQLRGMFDQALPYYRRAAVLITAELKAQPGDPTALSFPALIYYPTPLLATRNLNRAPDEVVDRFVETAFTVTAQGTVKDIRVNDKDATSRQIAEATDSIRLARYRPKFVNGEPVETTDFIYRQVFKQRKEAE